MITAGIDVGLENIKIVILKDKKIVGKSKGVTGGAKRAEAVEGVWREAIKSAGLKKEDVGRVVARGRGKYDVPFADDWLTEPVTLAKGIRQIYPEVTTVVDVGADETLVICFGSGNRIQQFLVNEKCAAGIGGFLKNMASRLELSLDEMSALPPKVPDSPSVSDGCVVFAELDALSLLNHGSDPKVVAAAITDAAAIRACMVINDITVPNLNHVVVVGGLTNNAAFVKALKSYLAVDFAVPEDAEYIGALGAALYAESETPIILKQEVS